MRSERYTFGAFGGCVGRSTAKTSHFGTFYHPEVNGETDDLASQMRQDTLALAVVRYPTTESEQAELEDVEEPDWVSG